MKNSLKLSVVSAPICAAVLLFCVCAAVYADDISVYTNGTRLEFDAEPYIQNDRTMVPMRGIFEALGAEVEWDDPTQTVTATRADKEVSLTIGSDIMYAGSETITLDAPAVLVSDRTFVPLRAVSEALDCEVLWDEELQRIDINSPAGTAAQSGTVPSFTELFGIEPQSVRDGDSGETYYTYKVGDPSAYAESYGAELVKNGFTQTDAGEYTIYTSDEFSVLVGVHDGILLAVVAKV